LSDSICGLRMIRPT